MGRKFGKLSHADLLNVVEIIQRNEGIEEVGDEFVVDFDSYNDLTLRELYAYINERVPDEEDSDTSSDHEHIPSEDPETSDFDAEKQKILMDKVLLDKVFQTRRSFNGQSLPSTSKLSTKTFADNKSDEDENTFQQSESLFSAASSPTNIEHEEVPVAE